MGGAKLDVPIDVAGEGITTRPVEVRLLCGRGVRFATVVCKDVLTDPVPRALGRAGATVVAVPAWSDDLDPFVRHAGEMVSLAQTTTVVANGPLEIADGHLGVVRPLRRPNATVELAGGQQPCVIGFDPRHRDGS